MTGFSSSVPFFRLFLSLLVATIGLQAMPASQLAIQPDHGSAFSASTIEVAVAPQPERVTKVKLLPLSKLPFIPQTELLAPRAGAFVERSSTSATQTGPPPLAVTALPYPPRAPPTA